MQKVKAVAVVTLTDGLIELSDAQALKRFSCVVKTDKPSVYEIVKPIQFKAGELFGVESVGKTVETLVDVIKKKPGRPAKVETD